MALDAKRIEKTMRKLRKLVRKAPKRPTPENIHDLRTYTRRFEAAAAALQIDSSGNERRLLRGLARVRKRAGKVRDMDVLTSYAADTDATDQPDCRIQLLEYLGAKRYRQADRLKIAMKARRPALRRRLKRAAKRLEKMVSANSSGSSAAQNDAPAQAMGSAVKLSRELAQPRILNRGNLHPYRLKVKELRNLLRLSDSRELSDFIDSLGHVKDAIGEWHDWEELVAIASDLDEHGANCTLVRHLKEISDQKYEQALSLTNRMRKEYLRASGADRRHAARELRPRPQTLQAVARIAS